MATIHRSGIDNARYIITPILGVVFGFFIGILFPFFSHYKIYLPSSYRSSAFVAVEPPAINGSMVSTMPMKFNRTDPRIQNLPTRIVVSETDLNPRRLWGLPMMDFRKGKAKYLATFSVGMDQMNNIDACVRKFSEDFQILLFHYDGRTNEWERFKWSKKAIHISVAKQTKWWYAKRFLHPDVVSSYEYIFIWDEDLGVEHFNVDRYIELVKKHGLEISQPGVEGNDGLTQEMTKRRGDQEVHKFTMVGPDWCSDQHLLPCAPFVGLMAPVFSRKAWRCVWHMIQNDLVHGWGLEFAFGRCAEPAHEKIGVVDSQWIIHQQIPSLAKQAKTEFWRLQEGGVKKRRKNEWSIFQNRLAYADESYRRYHGRL